MRFSALRLPRVIARVASSRAPFSARAALDLGSRLHARAARASSSRARRVAVCRRATSRRRIRDASPDATARVRYDARRRVSEIYRRSRRIRAKITPCALKSVVTLAAAPFFRPLFFFFRRRRFVYPDNERGERALGCRRVRSGRATNGAGDARAAAKCGVVTVDARDAARGRRDDRARERRPRQRATSFDASARVRARRDVGARRRFDARERARSARASVARRSARASVARVATGARRGASERSRRASRALELARAKMRCFMSDARTMARVGRGRRNAFSRYPKRRDAGGRGGDGRRRGGATAATGGGATAALGGGGTRDATARADTDAIRCAVGGFRARERPRGRCRSSDRSNARARARASDRARGASTRRGRRRDRRRDASL